MRDILDHPANPTVAGVGMLSTNAFDLPFWINVATAVYLFLLITHKAWHMYKDWKNKDGPSGE